MMLRSLAAAGLLLAMMGCDNNRDDEFDTTYTTTDRTIREADRDIVGPDRATRDNVREGYDSGAADRNWNEHQTQPGAIIRPNQPSTGGTTGGATGGTTSPQRDAASLSQVDRTFVQEAIAGGLFEVQSGQMALERNPDPKVMEAARMIVEDHQKANQELMTILDRRNIDYSETLTGKYQTMLNQLRSMQGQEFAQHFRTMQRDAHEEAIALFQRQAREGSDAELKAFAQRTLPVLQKHLDHIQQMDNMSGSSMPDHDE